MIPGMLYPVMANVEQHFLEYVSDAVAYHLTKNSPYENTKADLSDLVLTKDHYVDWKADNGVTLQKAQFFNRKAEVILKNNTAGNRMVYGLDIYAHVLWRSARREISASYR